MFSGAESGNLSGCYSAMISTTSFLGLAWPASAHWGKYRNTFMVINDVKTFRETGTHMMYQFLPNFVQAIKQAVLAFETDADGVQVWYA